MGHGVRANWHVADFGTPEDSDPMQEIAQLRSEGTAVELKSAEELHADLARTIRTEGRWFAVAERTGDTSRVCDLKQEDRHVLNNPSGSLSCFTCPHFTEDPDDPRSAICAVGREQQGIVEQIRALQVAASLDEEMAVAYANDIEACAELAEAHADFALA